MAGRTSDICGCNNFSNGKCEEVDDEEEENNENSESEDSDDEAL